jgi:hypothetical protein
LAALVLIAVALGACESSQEKSAKLEKVAKQQQRLAPHGLSIARASTKIKVISTAIVRSSEGIAAVVTLRNLTATALRNAPIAITVKSAGGSVLYSNDAPGLAKALVSVPLVPADGSTSWVDDQVQTAGAPASVSAEVGEGEALTGALPRFSVQVAHLIDGEAEGTVANHSSVSQRELVIYATAMRASKLVAAGRAVIPQLAAGSSTRFQLFFIGNPQGTQIQYIAAPGSTG